MTEASPRAPGDPGRGLVASELDEGELFAGRFLVERRAGAGSAGVVYRALDQASGEPVALKILRKKDETAQRRFAVEAASLERLQHPTIVRHLSHGVSDKGEPFLAMEWLEGESLRARLDRGPLGLGEALDLCRRLADALAASHAQGVLHRDIKPSNIMLVGGSIAGAKVIDFGVARDATRAPVTTTGGFVGTIGYLAPEQARGERNLDGRADLFSLGCVLFRCLTNAEPFEGRDSMTVLAKLVMHEAPRAADLRPEVPAELDDLVAKLLEKDRERRPPSAEALSVELARLAEGVATGALRPADPGRKRSAPPRAGEGAAAPTAAAAADEALAPAPRSRRLYLALGLGLAALLVAAALLGRGLLLAPFFTTTPAMLLEPMSFRNGVRARPRLARALPPAVRLVAAGEVWTRADADALLAKGADALALGRSVIANPDWAACVADPAFEPRRPPLSVAELGERGLSPHFAAYMRNWKGFVAD
ncbi:MAG TPA: protein kinase [Polyangiaceae bacterium]|nr:protein kinase [Polyangiaceae bacterium]